MDQRICTATQSRGATRHARTGAAPAALSRRALLGGLPTGVLLAHPWLRRVAFGQDAAPALTVHQQAPLVAEPPLSALVGQITPNQLFHVLTIMADPLPAIDPAQWRLEVEGQVDRSLTLDYEQLRALPARSMAAVLECAGNSRNSVSPPLEESYLNSGYVGNALWTGAPLRIVLERAGIKPEVSEVVLEGADRGTPDFAPGEVAYAKSIPIDKALHPDTLLVYEMNGVPLPREHGGPVRALTPGWYGTYSVKWLTRIALLDRPFDGVFMTELWRIRERHEGFVQDASITQVRVKSLIFEPGEDEEFGIGEHIIRGAAWSGGKDITSVQVSTDGGASWRFAQLLPRGEEGSSYAWRQWEFPWQAQESGSYSLMARATDTSGAAQPFAYDFDLNGFGVNQVQPVKVRVG
jgi:DMSO/TMAO reductase YedYZ molybdopterin-dependent catalytic subunit